MDLDTLYQDILLAFSGDPIATKHISTDGWWSTDPNGLLLLDNKIYVLSAGNLCTCVLQYNHDHILAGYFGQNKTLELVHRGYSWPSFYADVQQFCKSCVTCMWSKPQRHKPYMSRSLTMDLTFIFRFSFYFIFPFSFFFYFLFLEQLGLGFISHAVTSVTGWWHSHKTDHRTWGNKVEGSRIKWCYTV